MLNQVFKKQEQTRGEQLIKAVKAERQNRDMVSSRDAIQILNNVKLNIIIASFNTLENKA